MTSVTVAYQYVARNTSLAALNAAAVAAVAALDTSIPDRDFEAGYVVTTSTAGSTPPYTGVLAITFAGTPVLTADLLGDFTNLYAGELSKALNTPVAADGPPVIL
jgi:hypothetical protein